MIHCTNDILFYLHSKGQLLYDSASNYLSKLVSLITFLTALYLC